MIRGDLNGRVGALAEGYEGVHGGSGIGVGNTEIEEYLSLGILSIWSSATQCLRRGRAD